MRRKFRLVSSARRRELDDAQDRTRECARAQVLSRARECCLRARGVELHEMIECQLFQQIARQCNRVGFRRRLELNAFQEPAQRWPELQETCGRRRGRLGPYENAARGDCGKYLI